MKMIGILSLIVFTYSGLGQEQHPPSEIDVCSLIAHPKQYNGKRLRIHARVEGGGVEGGTWLEDASCKDSGVKLSVPENFRKHQEEHPDFKALDDAIRFQGNIGTAGKKITGTFTGNFISHSKRRIFTLEKVEDLDVKSERTSP
jgi:hypothetical protein